MSPSNASQTHTLWAVFTQNTQTHGDVITKKTNIFNFPDTISPTRRERCHCKCILHNLQRFYEVIRDVNASKSLIVYCTNGIRNIVCMQLLWCVHVCPVCLFHPYSQREHLTLQLTVCWAQRVCGIIDILAHIIAQRGRHVLFHNRHISGYKIKHQSLWWCGAFEALGAL